MWTYPGSRNSEQNLLTNFVSRSVTHSTQKVGAIVMYEYKVNIYISISYINNNNVSKTSQASWEWPIKFFGSKCSNLVGSFPTFCCGQHFQGSLTSLKVNADKWSVERRLSTKYDILENAAYSWWNVRTNESSTSGLEGFYRPRPSNPASFIIINTGREILINFNNDNNFSREAGPTNQL